MNRRSLFKAALGLPFLAIPATVEGRFQPSSRVVLDVMVTRDGGLNLDEPVAGLSVLLLTNDSKRHIYDLQMTRKDGIARVMSHPGTFLLEIREWSDYPNKLHHTVLHHSETVELLKDRQITVRLP